MKLHKDLKEKLREHLAQARLSLRLERNSISAGEFVRARVHRADARMYMARARHFVSLCQTYEDVPPPFYKSAVKVFPSLPKFQPGRALVNDSIKVSIPAARPRLRVQRMFRGSLANKTATIALAIAVVPGLCAGWTARSRKWPMVLHSGNSVRKTLAATSTAETLASSTQ